MTDIQENDLLPYILTQSIFDIFQNIMTFIAQNKDFIFYYSKNYFFCPHATLKKNLKALNNDSLYVKQYYETISSVDIFLANFIKQDHIINQDYLFVQGKELYNN